MTLAAIAAAITAAVTVATTAPGCVFCTSVDTTFEHECRASGGELRVTATMALCVPPGGVTGGAAGAAGAGEAGDGSDGGAP